MPFKMPHPAFSRTTLSALVMLLVLAIAFVLYVVSEKRIDRANESRQLSFQLADQLRQSSDDLTTMARNLVVTGDPIYQQYFNDILAIRDGRKPRPAGYSRSYWDLVLAGEKRPEAGDGEAVALLDLIGRTGCTEAELARLAEAKANSDRLAGREAEAMRLATSTGADAEKDRARAIRMMHDLDYHQAKAAIMRPINDFYAMMDERTAGQVRAAENVALAFRIVFILAVLLAAWHLWRTYRELRSTLGGSAKDVYEHIRRIGQGDFSTAIEVAPAMQDSVLAGLARMQEKLQAHEAERQRAEDALRAGTDRLNEAQRLAQIGNWTLDLVSGELFWSDQVFRLFEIDPGRFGATYDAFLAAIHPDDREAVHQAYQTSLATRTPYAIIHRLLMPDGRIKWVQEKCLSDFDADGKPLRSYGTIQDITERKETEAELRIAATAFESQDGMMVTDADNVILRVNQAFTRITGYSAEEVIGTNPRLLKSDRHDDDFYRAMWESLNTTGGWQGEIWDRRKNGEVYPKWLTISVVKNEAGQTTHYIAAQHDITERKKAEEKINELAFFDQLTGLPNRTLLVDRLRQTIAASSRSGHHAALLFIDLDHFKTLNDTLGHDKGDALLRQVAQRLVHCVREGDTVARLGGDEFVVVLAGLSEDLESAAADTEAIAGKILAAVNETYRLGDVLHHSSASIGATLFNGEHSRIDDLLKQADLAMYKSKEAGRNALRFFDPHMESAVRERAALEESLRLALAEKQFLLHYQPQVEGDGVITGAEALLRWQRPGQGLVAPGDFIPLAEETGLILPLGRWVLETACRQLSDWSRRPDRSHLTIAVNVSAHQFRQAGFVDQVQETLSRTGANPARLKLELTESLLVHNIEEVIGKMVALKAGGVAFSLDDFGTGYSSLSYLKRLPLDQLKIDRSFVNEVLTDPNDAVIARAIVALAQSLGLGVIAEGVETAAQRDFLASTGCQAYQGYFFSRPLPLDEFEKLAGQGRSGVQDTSD